MNKYLVIIMIIIVSLFIAEYLEAGENTGQNVITVQPYKLTAPPKIDGKLDDTVWQKAPTVDDIFITYNPVDGDVLPKKTKVWVAYDPDNLYIAFYCYDSEPGKIKTSVTKRDNLWNDDWVGFALDPLGNRQCLYEFFVNPSGMQADMYNTPASGENSAPDWVWYSGGQITKDGYTVEIKLPLKSIRFNHGKNVEMNIVFWRRISRLGMSGSWPMLDPGKGLINSATEIKFDELNKQLLLEFIPSVTYSSIWDRETPSRWSAADSFSDIGISAKYGITSSITAEVTINPDFSQVESDTFQILTNQRYPIFYSEKRPFFMEAGDMFDLAGSGENMWTAVHTRRIVSPAWGARITGDTGKLSFGFMAAGDNWAGRNFGDDEDNFYLGKDAYFMIGRTKLSIGNGNYVGLLYSGKELGEFHNRVVAADTVFRFGGDHTFSANYIYTDTNDAENGENYSGGAISAKYQYSTKSLYGRVHFEKYDSDFRMDTAYYRRTGIISSEIVVIPVINLRNSKASWINSVKPVIIFRYLHDYETGMDDTYFNTGIMFDFPKQGYFVVAYDFVDNESWEGTTYEKSSFWGRAGIQLTKWLNLHTCWNLGGYIYYDEDDPFLGNRFRSHSAVDLQLGDNLSMRFSYEYTDFDRDDTEEDVYNYHIFYTRATYQLSKSLFFRALVQYDSYVDLFLTDILASYELVPGTVIHIGYGSLHNKLEWDTANSKWLDDSQMRQFYQTSQSVFIKGSYRLQL